MTKIYQNLLKMISNFFEFFASLILQTDTELWNMINSGEFFQLNYQHSISIR